MSPKKGVEMHQSVSIQSGCSFVVGVKSIGCFQYRLLQMETRTHAKYEIGRTLALPACSRGKEGPSSIKGKDQLSLKLYLRDSELSGYVVFPTSSRREVSPSKSSGYC